MTAEIVASARATLSTGARSTRPGDRLCDLESHEAGAGRSWARSRVRALQRWASTSPYWGYANPRTTEVDRRRVRPQPILPRCRGSRPADRVRAGSPRRRIPDSLRGGSTPFAWTLRKTHCDCIGRLARVHPDRGASQGHRCRPTTRVLPASINGASSRPGATGRRLGRSPRRRRGRGDRDGRPGYGSFRLCLEGRVHAQRSDRVSVSGTKVDGAIRPETPWPAPSRTRARDSPDRPPRRPPTPPDPATPTPPTEPTPPTRPTPPPVPPPPPARRRARPGRDQVGRPTEVALGGRLTWTMTVVNRSAVAAADVNGLKLDDPRSFRTRLISLTRVARNLQALLVRPWSTCPGASATVTAVTEATQWVSSWTSSGSAPRRSNRITATTSPPCSRVWLARSRLRSGSLFAER